MAINLPIRYINDNILKDNAIRIIKPYYNQIVSIINDVFSDIIDIKKCLIIFTSLSRENIDVNKEKNRIEIVLYEEKNHIPVEYIGEYFASYKNIVSRINDIFRKSGINIYSKYNEQEKSIIRKKKNNTLIVCIPFSYMEFIGIRESSIFESVEFI